MSTRVIYGIETVFIFTPYQNLPICTLITYCTIVHVINLIQSAVSFEDSFSILSVYIFVCMQQIFLLIEPLLSYLCNYCSQSTINSSDSLECHAQLHVYSIPTGLEIQNIKRHLGESRIHKPNIAKKREGGKTIEGKSLFLLIRRIEEFLASHLLELLQK